MSNAKKKRVSLRGSKGTIQRVLKLIQPYRGLVLFTLLLGLVLSAVGIAAMPVVSRFLGATDAMMSDCVLYGRIVTGFTFSFMLQNVFQSFFIAAEKPRLGLLVTVAAGVTNMVLDALFIAVLRWGVAGAAIATGLSQCVGGVLPLLLDVDGIWWAITAAECFAFLISAIFLVAKRNKYHYM